MALQRYSLRLTFLVSLVLFVTALRAERTIRVGFLTNSLNQTNYGYSFELNAAALTMGIKQLQKDRIINGIKFEYTWRDAGVSVANGLGRSVELWNQNIDVMFGPPDSEDCKAVGLLTTYWNLPHFSWIAAGVALSDRGRYTTLVRTRGPHSKFPDVIARIAKYYEWNQIAIFMSNDGYCEDIINTMRAILVEQGLRISKFISYDSLDDEEMLVDSLLEIKRRARIVILCDTAGNERRIMLTARHLGMVDEEWVYITNSRHADTASQRPWYVYGDAYNNSLAREAYKHVIDLTWAATRSDKVDEFNKTFAQEMAADPWNNTYALDNNKTADPFSTYLYDAAYLYGLALNKTLAQGRDPRDGVYIRERASSIQFFGMSGVVAIDENGDRNPDYWVWDYQGEDGYRRIFLRINMSKDGSVVDLSAHNWYTSDNLPPPYMPSCGFTDQLCPPDPTLPILLSLLLAVILAVCVYILYRLIKQQKLRFELSQRLWLVKYDDISFVRSKSMLPMRSRSYCSMASGRSLNKSSRTLGSCISSSMINVGTYKGEMIVTKDLSKVKFHLNTTDELDLKAMRDVLHENMNQFIGLSIDKGHECMLFIYCSKGSLQNILLDEDIKLDNTFKLSLISDLINGVSYLHSSSLGFHGMLKSSNCLINNRWVLKITDYGLLRHRVMCPKDDPIDEAIGHFWSAPEVLKAPNRVEYRSQEADIYSFGIIVYEILHRRMPYDITVASAQDIVVKIRNSEFPPYRPVCDQQFTDADAIEIVSIMKLCWNEAPDSRPTITQLKLKMKQLFKANRFSNIMDHMLSMMESYANNLEELVNQRTQELTTEKKKVDTLLYRMLPEIVADSLKIGKPVPPDTYDSVTIYFSDIVGFTTISAMSTPIQVVDLLNELYTMFDNTIEKYDVYKVETIGDSYMVASGLPRRNENRHASHIADMALSLISSVLTFTIKHMPEVQLQMRIGIHTGPCCAGVVGASMPRYCLFGDTVNTASRMESHGEPMRIHVTQTTYDLLNAMHVYTMKCRGDVMIKGKGTMRTYWLVHKNGFEAELPHGEDFTPVIGADGLPRRRPRSSSIKSSQAVLGPASDSASITQQSFPIPTGWVTKRSENVNVSTF